MRNETLGVGLGLTLAITFLVVLVEDSMTTELSDALYTILSLNLYFWGIWSCIRLSKKEKESRKADVILKGKSYTE